MLITQSTTLLIAHSFSVILAVSFLAPTAMPVVAKTFAATVLLQVGSRPTQLLFHAAGRG